jgi:hypothetical protein
MLRDPDVAKAASARYNKSCNIGCRLCVVVVRVVAGFLRDAQQTDDAQVVFKFHREGQRSVVVVGLEGFLAPRFLRAMFE